MQAHAAPGLIDYQARVTDAEGNAVNGTVSITFRVWNASEDGSVVWSETQSDVHVSKGLFHVMLGSVTSLPGDLFDGDGRWLGLQVESDPEMAPRTRIASVAYALQAARADTAAAADSATNAGYATTAGSATSAGHATTADSATTAGHATTANSATTATSATSAATAAYATTAGSASTADSATTAGYATTAGSAPADSDWTEGGGNVYRTSGRVGIGTSAPQSALHVEGILEVDQSIKANDSGGLELATDDSIIRMKIIDNGNVGIGTTSPESMLHVNGTVEIDQQIKADDSGGLEFATDEGTVRMKLADNGYVGIGTPSPGKRLHVYQPTGSYDTEIETDSGRVRLLMDGTSSNNAIAFQKSNVEMGSMGYDLTHEHLFLYEGGNVVLKDGKMGVNTLSPAARLDVHGTVKVGSTGTAFGQIYELTGTTSNNDYSLITLPAGFTTENTHVLSVKIYLFTEDVIFAEASDYGDALRLFYDKTYNSWRLSHYFLELHNRRYKILIMRMYS